MENRSAFGVTAGEIFVSYAWGGESERVVDELEQAFAQHGLHLVRDKKALEYKGSIQEFEQRIGQGQCIVLVISDKYLRSEHCMYELVEIDEHRELRKRIFPLVLPDARIYKALDRLDYIQYWDQQIEQLNQAIKQIQVMTNLKGIAADLDKYARIRASFDHLTELLSDMNTLTPEIHAASGFSTLIEAVKNAGGRPGQDEAKSPEKRAAASFKLDPQARAALLRGLQESFSLNDLKTLCFELGVDFDNLEGEGKTAKARELIVHLERRARVSELIQKCASERPDYPW
jgi:hypothetical protein